MMWEASYGKEPFDMRLTILRMFRCWKQIAFWTITGMLVFWGIYCVKNLFLSGDTKYCGKSTYRVEFSVAEEQVGAVMINAATWDTYVHTAEFLSSVKSHLPGELKDMKNEELGSLIQGKLETDWRIPSTEVISTNQVQCTQIAKAVEEAMVEDFPKGISEIDSIRVIDPAGDAKELPLDVRPARAAILGFVLAFFFTLLIFLLLELSSDAIWLPATLQYRYGLKTVGTMESRELAANLDYFFQTGQEIAICPVREECNPKAVEKKLRDKERTKKVNWFCTPSPLLCPECTDRIRKADGVLLLVNAGPGGGKQTEAVLNYLRQQDCTVTAAMLVDADETLITQYYGFRRKPSGK